MAETLDEVADAIRDLIHRVYEESAPHIADKSTSRQRRVGWKDRDQWELERKREGLTPEERKLEREAEREGVTRSLAWWSENRENLLKAWEQTKEEKRDAKLEKGSSRLLGEVLLARVNEPASFRKERRRRQRAYHTTPPPAGTQATETEQETETAAMIQGEEKAELREWYAAQEMVARETSNILEQIRSEVQAKKEAFLREDEEEDEDENPLGWNDLLYEAMEDGEGEGNSL